MHKIISCSREGVVIFNTDGRMVYANKSFLDLCEYQLEELKYLSGAEFSTKIFPDQSYKIDFASYILDIEPTSGRKYILRTKKGHYIPVEVRILKARHSNQETRGTVMLINEIKSLLEADSWRNKANALLNITRAGVIGINKLQEITIFNQAAEQLLQLERNMVLGRKHDEIFNGLQPNRKLLVNTLLYGLELYGEEFYDFPYAQRDGVFVVNTIQLRDQFDEVTGAMAIFQDVTDQRKYEEELARAETLAVVSQIAAGVAHEVRNPLTAVKGFIQLLANGGTDATKQAEYYQLILEELDRANEIISDFLMLTKPQQKEMQEGDVNDLLNHIISLVESQAFVQGIEIQKEFEPDLPPVLMAPGQIK